MSTKREWRCFVGDMAKYCRRVLHVRRRVDKTAFAEDWEVRDLIWANLTKLGEAAAKVPPEVREERPEVPWKQIVGTRNRLVHGYFGVNWEVVWLIVGEEVPSLLPMLEDTRDGPPSTERRNAS